MSGIPPGQGLRVFNLSAHGDAFHGPCSYPLGVLHRHGGHPQFSSVTPELLQP